MRIQHETTTPYTLKQNDLAERKSMTVMNVTRCMLKEMKLLHTFWCKSFTTNFYVLNRSPTKRFNMVKKEI